MRWLPGRVAGSVLSVTGFNGIVTGFGAHVAGFPSTVTGFPSWLDGSTQAGGTGSAAALHLEAST